MWLLLLVSHEANFFTLSLQDWITKFDLASDVRRSNSYAHNWSTKVPRIINWCLPLLGQVKLNIDGSSLGNPGRTGFGGLIYYDKGNWITDFSGYVVRETNYPTNFMAKLGALEDLDWRVWDLPRDGISHLLSND
ncbi:unnamed protein product [Lupinus luteus]|uniref:RNase H type-1 domain-containing protein n=1 Tax=Lupinus luteus TaxID=3873 RepID=A0AAV1WTG4_LUPLU